MVVANIVVENCTLNEGLTLDTFAVTPINFTPSAGPLTSGQCEVNGTSVKIFHSIFRNNSNTLVSGGIRGFLECNMEVENVKFINNSGGSGGGAFIEGHLIMKNVEFSNNFALVGGGLALSLGNYTISNATFQNNTARFGGGAISANPKTVLMLVETSLTGNKAGIGGALTIEDSILVAANTSFWNNTVSPGGGGAMLAVSSSVNMTNTTVNENFGGQGAGFILENVNLTMSGFRFSRNGDVFTTSDGGGIHVSGISQAFSLVSDDSTDNLGNAVKSVLILENGIFSDNSAVRGGAMSCQNNTRVNIENITFTRNTASIAGGAIHGQGSADFITAAPSSPQNDSSFIAEAVEFGENLFVDLPTATTLRTDPDLPQSRGILSTLIEIRSGNFQDNKVLIGAGGAVFVEANTILTVDKTEFVNNSVVSASESGDGSGGGAIGGRSVTIGIVNSTFVNNRIPDSNGGAIALTVSKTPEETKL